MFLKSGSKTLPSTEKECKMKLRLSNYIFSTWQWVRPKLQADTARAWVYPRRGYFCQIGDHAGVYKHSTANRRPVWFRDVPSRGRWPTAWDKCIIIQIYQDFKNKLDFSWFWQNNQKGWWDFCSGKILWESAQGYRNLQLSWSKNSVFEIRCLQAGKREHCRISKTERR